MKVAINQTVINKARPDEYGRITHTFENLELSPEVLVESINKGCASAPTHRMRAIAELCAQDKASANRAVDAFQIADERPPVRSVDARY